MQFAETEICRLTEGIWSSMLGLEVERSPQAVTLGAGYYSGTVRVTGGWDGTVYLDCSPELARSLAAIMFGGEPDTTETDEIRDALGELTNMLGGNIKSLLPGPSQLSLPDVSEGMDESDHKLRLSGGQLLGEVGFYCEGGPLRVTVIGEDAKSPVQAAAGETCSGSGADGAGDQTSSVSHSKRPSQDSPMPEAGNRKQEAGSLNLAAFVPQSTEMSTSAPEEIRRVNCLIHEGQRIVEEAQGEADRLLEEARAEAERTVSAARTEAERLVEDSQIRCIAIEQAAEILTAAERQAEEIRSGARSYAEEVLANLEGCVNTMLASIHDSQEWLRSR